MNRNQQEDLEMVDMNKNNGGNEPADDGLIGRATINLSKIVGFKSDRPVAPEGSEPSQSAETGQQQISDEALTVIDEYAPKIKAELRKTTTRWAVIGKLVSQAEQKGVKGKAAMTRFGEVVELSYSSLRKMVKIDRDEGLRQFMAPYEKELQIDDWTRLDEVRKIIRSDELKEKFRTEFFAAAGPKAITRKRLMEFRKSNGLVVPDPKPKTETRIVFKREREPEAKELRRYSELIELFNQLPCVDVLVGEDLQKRIKERPWLVRKPGDAPAPQSGTPAAD